ncbi:MAG: ATP-binding protein, partial [Acidobacteriota bacterium]
VALVDPSGSLGAVWGEALAGEGLNPRELAGRDLRGGWRIVVLAPHAPHDVLTAFAAAGLRAPTAAFDRAGVVVGRGGTFRPISPASVGRALAAGRSWGWVGLGEREHRAYLRAVGEHVVAIPLVRPPLAETGLQLAALALWGALPVAAWERRRTWRELWERRRSFAGRLRLLAAGVALLPLLLLGQLLPRQWVRQRERGRLELARTVSQPLQAAGVEPHLSWLVREMGAQVALYRSGALVWCSRPDLAYGGEIPRMAPAEAYVRAVRGWREPVVEGDGELNIYAPAPPGDGVVGVTGLHLAGAGDEPSPREWFVITAVLAAWLALAIGDRLGGRLAGPLRRLVRATRRLEQGEPVADLDVEGDEEMAELSRAFVVMAGKVQRREEELRGERDLLERVLGALSASVVVCRPGGEVELANPAARRLLGEETTLCRLGQHFAPALAPALERAARGEAVTTALRPAIAPEALWQATVIPLAGVEGRLLLVMEDLSEVARAERLASLAELARIVAHEVKNPLTPIRLWAEELQAALERSPADVVSVAEVAAAQILERVAHLREVAQGFSNLVALEHWEPETVEVVTLAREVAGEYAVLHQRGITVTQAGAAAAEVMADRRWLGRALRHLLENSVRAIGESAGTVEIEVALADAEVIVAVRDSGGGVSDKHLARLFEPHFSTTSEGTGLGLAVVQRVLMRAGGRVEARNVGQGLEVRLVFPAPPPR